MWDFSLAEWHMTITIRLINKNDTSKSCFETNGAAPSEKEFGQVVLDWFAINPTGSLHVSGEVWGRR